MVDRLGNLRTKAGIDDLEQGFVISYGTIIGPAENGAGAGLGGPGTASFRLQKSGRRESSGGGLSFDDTDFEKIMARLVSHHNTLTPLLQDIKDITAQIQVSTKETVTAISSDKERKISSRVNKLVEEGKDRIMQIKDILDELKEIQKTQDDEMTPAEAQMCVTIITSTSNSFRKHITAYMQAQENYRQAVKSKVERQLRIAYPDAPENEITELANEDPTSVREAIKQQVQRGGHADLHETLHDLHERFDDLKKLEESVLELRDMFIYLSALVDEQGEMLDDIENHVLTTKEYTGQAVEQIKIAKEIKDDYDSKRSWLYWIGCGVAIIVVVLVLMALGPFFSLLNACGMCLGCCSSGSSSTSPASTTLAPRPAPPGADVPSGSSSSAAAGTQLYHSGGPTPTSTRGPGAAATAPVVGPALQDGSSTSRAVGGNF